MDTVTIQLPIIFVERNQLPEPPTPWGVLWESLQEMVRVIFKFKKLLKFLTNPGKTVCNVAPVQSVNKISVNGALLLA